MNGLTEIDGERIRLMEELLNLSPAEKALIQVSNLLATTPIGRLTREAVMQPLTVSNVDLEVVRPRLRTIYAHVLEHFVLDRQLTDQEEAELEHLRDILNLTQEDVEEVFSSVVHSSYEQLARRSSAGQVRDAGTERLLELSRALKIPEEEARWLLNRG